MIQRTAICLDSKHGAGSDPMGSEALPRPAPRLSDRGRTRAVTHSQTLFLLFLILFKGHKSLRLMNNIATDVRNFPLDVRNFPLTVRNFPCHPQLDAPCSPLNVRLQELSQLQEVPHI